MLILSIDCAGSGCGVCVWHDGAALANKREDMQRGQDQRLMPMIVEAMHQASVSFDQLDRIAVTRGPGSFTGLRIGLAAARGIGLASGKPVIGIDRFAIFRALAALDAPSFQHLVVIQSRRKELYCRFYSADGTRHTPIMMTDEEIIMFLNKHSGTTVTGDIAPDAFTNYQPANESEHITAAKIAAEADINDPAFAPRPLYIRLPDVTFPKNHVVLRQLSPAHAEQLAILYNESFSKAAWSFQQIQSSLALDTTRAWGFFEGEKIYGFILCQLIPDQSEILAFCVHPSKRRSGVGEKLMRCATDAARAKGSHLYLEVAADNVAAIALYEKLGFRQSGHRPRYYQIGKTSVDALLYTLPTYDGDLPPA